MRSTHRKRHPKVAKAPAAAQVPPWPAKDRVRWVLYRLALLEELCARRSWAIDDAKSRNAQADMCMAATLQSCTDTLRPILDEDGGAR